MQLVFGKSGLWSKVLRIHEFEHDGPSRSGKATISIVSAPDHHLIVYAHHEGAESYTLTEWNEQMEIWKENLSSPSESEREGSENMVKIDKIIQDFINK